VAGLLGAGLLLPATAPMAQAAQPPGPDVSASEELDSQRGEAAELAAEVAAQELAVAQAETELDELAEQAGAALEEYQVAMRDRDDALAEQRVQEQRLAAARDVLAGSRTDLGLWASRAYRDGGAMAHYEGLMTLLEAENTDDLGRRLSMLEVVGRVRGSAVDTARLAEDVQRDATIRARDAADQAVAAAERAAVAKDRTDDLLTRQREQLSVLKDLLTTVREDSDAVSSRAAQMERARALADHRRLVGLPGGDRMPDGVTGPPGACQGGDVSRYPNGNIPAAVLCPLESAPAHRLRADAAYAFDSLAAAYADAFGKRICITDSYRTLAAQVRLAAQKPNLAARPGRSNHGWATAVDLCGGIETFGSTQHRWMRDNAPLYGWYHPSWARQGGSRPEPWHWEFGG
jgi:hypothetical protein